MSSPGLAPNQQITRRRFFKTGLCGAAGLAFYSGEVERHWIEVTRRDVALRGLPAAFDGLKVVQLSDIHLEEFTEPFLLEDAVRHINQIAPDVVLLTGDFVSYELLSKKRTVGAAWKCAELLRALKCPQVFASMGNHDVMVGESEVTSALAAQRIPVLKNAFVPLDRRGDRVWIAGLDDPLLGAPDLDCAIPQSIRNREHEPVLLMCHAPDYMDHAMRHPSGSSIGLALSGHTHGGQVRLPLIGAMQLPPGGRKYVEGFFRFGNTQLYVNRGLGSVGLPFRFDCPPEITAFTLRRA